MREHDHLVEPLFGALRRHDGAEARVEGAAPASRRLALAGLVTGAILLGAALALFG